MKTAVFLAFALLQATPAFSQQPMWQRHEKEARGYLAPCHQPNDKDQQECLTHQRDFIHSYVTAFGGDPMGMLGTAGVFLPAQPDHTHQIWAAAVPPRPVDACASWKMLSVLSNGLAEYADVANEQCGALPEADRQAAANRFAVLAIELRIATPPPEKWTPKITGLREWWERAKP